MVISNKGAFLVGSLSSLAAHFFSYSATAASSQKSLLLGGERQPGPCLSSGRSQRRTCRRSPFPTCRPQSWERRPRRTADLAVSGASCWLAAELVTEKRSRPAPRFSSDRRQGPTDRPASRHSWRAGGPSACGDTPRTRAPDGGGRGVGRRRVQCG